MHSSMYGNNVDICYLNCIDFYYSTASKAKYTFSDDEDEEKAEKGSGDDEDNINSPLPSDDDFFEHSSEDDDFMPFKAKSPKKVAKPRYSHYINIRLTQVCSDIVYCLGKY